MNHILLIIIAGLVGTSAMVVTMAFIHSRKMANADMVRAIGTIFIQPESEAYSIGLIVHYSVGVFFAFLYAFLLEYAPIKTPEAALIMSTFAGLVHGLVVSIMLVVAVAEHHPVRKYREAGIGVALSHLIGHVVYGFGVGIVFYIAWQSLQGYVGHAIARPHWF